MPILPISDLRIGLTLTGIKEGGRGRGLLRGRGWKGEGREGRERTGRGGRGRGPLRRRGSKGEGREGRERIGREGGDGGPLRDKGVEMGGEEGKGRRKGEGKDREGSAITGTNPYC